MEHQVCSSTAPTGYGDSCPTLEGMGLPAYVAAVAGAVPRTYFTNGDLELMVETTDEWIVERTGIVKRHIAPKDMAASDLAARAAEGALSKASLDALDLDLVIVATVTPDMPLPATACLVQEMIGARRAACFDLSAGCSGFIYALIVAAQMVSAGAYSNALVIGVDILSRVTDWSDRNTCVLFGDGAGAAVVRRSANGAGVLSFELGADGSAADLLTVPGGGSRNPASVRSVTANLHTIKMNGREVFRMASRKMFEAVTEVVERSGHTLQDVDCLVPHQANLRIIQSLCKRLDFPMAKVMVNVMDFGNTSAASIPLALAGAEEKGLLKSGDLTVLASFGAGMTWAAAALLWGEPDRRRAGGPS